MVTSHTRCSVCVIIEKLSVHLWMLPIQLDFMIFFFFSLMKLSIKNVGKNIEVRCFPLICPKKSLFHRCCSVLQPSQWKHLLCCEYPLRNTHTSQLWNPIIHMTKLQREAKDSLIIMILPDGTCCGLTLSHTSSHNYSLCKYS